jgi:hypothetical protein
MKFLKNTKLIVRSNNISFFTTVKQIQHGVGCSCAFNTAVYDALNFLKDKNKIEETLGVLGTFGGLQIQLGLVEND